eukprot:gene8426-biopygen3667
MGHEGAQWASLPNREGEGSDGEGCLNARSFTRTPQVSLLLGVTNLVDESGVGLRHAPPSYSTCICTSHTKRCAFYQMTDSRWKECGNLPLPADTPLS